MSNGSLSSQAHYEKLRSFQLRARLRDAGEGPRSTMVAPRGYWLTAKGHCTSRQLVATRKGPAPMGIPRTHNKPQLLRPHRQVFTLTGPSLCSRPTGMCFAHVLSTYSNARESCAARENYWLSQQRKLLFPRPQSLSILPNSNPPFTLTSRASLKAFGQSDRGGRGTAQIRAPE